MGIEVPMSPWSFHLGPTTLCKAGGQKDPRELPSSTTLSQEDPGPPSQPGKAAGPAGSRGAPSSHTAQPRCNFGSC